MELVITSDWHSDWSTYGVPRWRDVERAVYASVEHAVNIGAGGYLFGGDLADPDTGGASYRSSGLAIDVAAHLSKAKIPSVWIRGNHDVYEDGSGASTLTPLAMAAKHFPGVYVAEEPRLFGVWKDLAVLCLPFMPVSHGVDMELTSDVLWPESGLHSPGCDLEKECSCGASEKPPPRVLVLSHLTVPGIHPGTETTEMPRGREILYPFTATRRAAFRVQGHYHERQLFSPPPGEGVELIIPGSLARLAFGEEDHEPGFLVLDVG